MKMEANICDMCKVALSTEKCAICDKDICNNKTCHRKLRIFNFDKLEGLRLCNYCANDMYSKQIIIKDYSGITTFNFKLEGKERDDLVAKILEDIKIMLTSKGVLNG